MSDPFAFKGEPCGWRPDLPHTVSEPGPVPFSAQLLGTGNHPRKREVFINMSVQTKVKEITMEHDGKTVLCRLTFLDGTTLDVQGPRSGLQTFEREENGVTIIDCIFNGFTLC